MYGTGVFVLPLFGESAIMQHNNNDDDDSQMREECERLHKSFTEKTQRHIRPCYLDELQRVFQDPKGAPDPETVASIFEPITRLRMRQLDVMDIIRLIDDGIEFSVPTKHALCASLFAAVSRSTTIAALHTEQLIQRALNALVPSYRRRHAVTLEPSDALLCYLQCALPVLGERRRHTALTVCAVLGQRGPRACTADVELQLLSAVGCSWGDVRRLVTQLSGDDVGYAQWTCPALVVRPFTFPAFSNMGRNCMPYPYTEEEHIRLLISAISACSGGVPASAALAPLLDMDYPISGAFLLHLLSTPLWPRLANNPAAQALLDSAPLSAVMYVAENMAPSARLHSQSTAVRMDACGTLWDVLSPDCAEDMALFSLGAISALSSHTLAEPQDFMSRMRATWGHVARAFRMYAEHPARMQKLVTRKAAYDAGRANILFPDDALLLSRYFSAEDAAAVLNHIERRSVDVCERLVNIVIDGGQCALLFEQSFLKRICFMGPIAARRFCDSLSTSDWDTIGNLCGSILDVSRAALAHEGAREALCVVAAAAPAWMKRFRSTPNGPTAAERLSEMRESVPDWGDWHLDDLIDRLTPCSLAKRAHVQ